ncbi:hypothetical protein B0T22DRAFT_304646 [Podospora appendiculata]|uniref:ATP-grasp domain-containing protein n=1 Tax=Podospora appendiculata TaxID=314037 RepID=A0AAE0WZP5_9PEZI|nr:hypothetical protein B0T22DRAFT_304646 [Podospora appendiculata]
MATVASTPGFLARKSAPAATSSHHHISHVCQSPRREHYCRNDYCRSYFWDVVPLNDLFFIVNVVVMPSPPGIRRAARKPYMDHPDARPTNGPPPPGSADCFFGALEEQGLIPSVWGTSDGVSNFTLIFSTIDGYMSRVKFFDTRLQDCPYWIITCKERLAPLAKYTAISPASLSSRGGSMKNCVENAAAIIHWGDLSTNMSISAVGEHMEGVSRELADRLNNTQWLTREPIPRKRVALVRGRPDMNTGSPVYNAARALGLDLVIIDEPGHWLQPSTANNKRCREAFLPTDMTEDAGVVNRIIKSLNAYPLPIHGIFTLSDNFFVTVATVAEAIGLPTCPVSAFEVAVDKYHSRLLQDSPGHTARVSSVHELNALLMVSADSKQPIFTPTYPVIVKPTKGWSSECVSKVSDPRDLALAVEKATKRHGSSAVIEPFFDGPEIDVNFVLLKGEILFCEIADEQPCQADANNATVHDTFSPEALTLPSALPAYEQEIAKSTLRDILVKLGFDTGIFHVEARMVNSSCEYREISPGIIDLVPKAAPPPERPVCRLLEINARPPGYRVSVPSRHTYGVDYFAVRMLAAVDDHERLRMVAQPFSHATGGGASSRSPGAQYWSRLVYIPAPAAGTVLDSRMSPSDELKLRRPDLAKHIVIAVDYVRPGSRIEMYTDGARTYVAHMLVCSRVSRQEAIEVGNEVLANYKLGLGQT